MEILGNQLLEMVRGCKQIILAAPFVKEHALARVLEAADEDAGVTLVTRWRLEELAAGVSDLGVYPLMKRRGGEVRLLPNLHAKYFRADTSCLSGSANLTGAALGWSRPTNLEILLASEAGDPRLIAFEGTLFASSVVADDEVYEALLSALSQMPPPPKVEFEFTQEAPPSLTFESWRPSLRQPGDLYRAYRGDDLTSAGRESAMVDLSVLELPSGLSEPNFDRAVGCRLLLHPEVRSIDHLLERPRRFGEVRQLLARRGCPDPARMWQTWMRWMLRFLPERYEHNTPRHSEIFARR